MTTNNTDAADNAEEPASPGDESIASLADRRGVETKVYQPAEDSGLLADAAEEFARGRTLEVGTGSGWVAEQIASDVTTMIAADVNPHACRAARERGIETVRTNLLDGFADDSFETVLFNPPYLPTDPENEWDDWMEQALSGGETGRELIEPFLDDLGRVLAPGGQALLLVSSLAGYDEVEELAGDAGLVAEEVRQESYPFESLSIMRLTKFALCGKPTRGKIP